MKPLDGTREVQATLLGGLPRSPERSPGQYRPCFRDIHPIIPYRSKKKEIEKQESVSPVPYPPLCASTDTPFTFTPQDNPMHSFADHEVELDVHTIMLV